MMKCIESCSRKRLSATQPEILADFLHRLSKPKPVCMPFFAAREVNSITPGNWSVSENNSAFNIRRV